MSNNPNVGGSSWSTSVGTTSATAIGRTRRPHTHRMERPGVDFDLSTTTIATKIEAEVVSTSRAEVQSFSRMPSQRRRRLWTLAARAAARRGHLSQDKEALSSGSLMSKNLGESSTQSSSFLKPGTVRTQDSGISSMDYLTSREANSPNSEEAGSRQRASLSITTAEQTPGACRQPPPKPFTPHASDVSPIPKSCRWPPPYATTIVVSGEGPMSRYANFCSTYVPDWACRNWSSAPRPLISRQRSSMEISYDIGPDWAASMETLNMQRILYPQNRGLFYGRYGRASCPKATSFFDHPFPKIYMEEENAEYEEENSGERVEAESMEVAVAEHLRRRRFEAPCWCERPSLPPPHPCSLRSGVALPAPTSVISPYFCCSGCPYRCMETGLMPVHQCDLAQRHIRRRRLKRMASEPTPPTWMAIEEAPAPAKRRPPPPEPLTSVTTLPPLPKKNAPVAHFSPVRLPLAVPPPPAKRMYSEARMITSTPRTDVFLMTPEPSTTAGEWRKWKLGGGAGRLMRGRSVDEAFYSPRWERHSSFLSHPRRPAYIYEEEEVKDWYPPQGRLGSETVSGLHHPYRFQSTGVSYGPSSCRTIRTPSAWYSTSPRCAPLLRPRSESGSRPPLLHTCALRARGRPSRCATRSSAASSLESSDATAATAATTPGAAVAAAPPWQLTSPLPTARHHEAPVAVSAAGQRKITRSGRSVGGGGSVGGSNDSTVGGRRKRRHLAALPKNADAASGCTQWELDVKWKRKSFKRSNGYDAADVMDHTTSASLEQIELLPLRQEAHPLPHNTTTTTTVHESRDKNDEYVEGKSVATRTRPIASPSTATTTTALEPRDLEAGIRKSTTPLDRVDGNAEVVAEEAEEEEDIDKIITLVTRPRSNPRGESLLRAQKSVVGEIGGNGGELSTLGFINRHDYWEHSAFGRSRIMAIVLASMAICCLLYCLVATTWAYSGPPGNITRRGLWQKCSIENGSCELTLPFISETDGWQGGATCILLVAILVGLLGTGLAILGHSGSNLVKRLYYFHSSGEIFFLAGFTTFLTFGIYRSYANLYLLNPRQTPPNPTQESHQSHTAADPATTVSPLQSPQLRWDVCYGSADTVGWSGGVLFMAAAVALLVDEFLHELARLGQTRWPRLASCLHWCALCVSNSNRRLRSTHRRCLGALCRKGTTSNFSVKAAEVSYRPTTGTIVDRHRRWRLRRQ